MFTGPYVPWDHYPKNLTFDEVQRPLSVVADFFSANSVTGHGKHLKEWRYYAVNDEHYDEKRHGPGTLLFIYDLNLKLIEAMYLLLCSYKQAPWKRKKTDEAQVAEEKAAWEYYPDNLSLKQQLNPYRAVNKFFKRIPPQLYRDYLHEWLHAAMYNEANPEDLYAGEVITVYENMLMLYSAGWMICQREGKAPKLRRTVEEPVPEAQVQCEQAQGEQVPEEQDLSEHIQHEPSARLAVEPHQESKTVDIHAIDPFPTEAEKPALEQIRNLVLRLCTNVQMIVHLGVHEQPFTFYLLILVSDEEKTPEHEISNKLEDNCRYLANIYAIVHKTASAKKGIDSSARFWTTAFSKGYVIYQQDGLRMPEANVIANSTIMERASADRERWVKQANAFYEGAVYYLDNNNYKLAAFLLHQAAESAMTAVIRCLSGYRLQGHSLSRLLRLTLLFTAEVKAVLNLDTTEGSQLFELLQSAYAGSRYTSSFDPDQASVILLAGKVRLLTVKAEEVCTRYISKLNSEDQ